MKNKPLFYRLAIFLAAQVLMLAAILGFFEGLARLRVWRLPSMHVQSGLEHPPYFNTPGAVITSNAFGKCVYRMNSIGLRGPEIPEKADEKRVLLIGDSFIFGARADQEGTISAQLEKQLNAAGQGRWLVINGGASSYNAWDYTGFLKAKGLALKPDFVIVNFFRNDHVPRSASSAAVKAASAPAGLGFLRNVLLKKSELAKAVLEFFNERQGARRPLTSLPKPLSPEALKVLAAFYPGDGGTQAAVKKYLEDYNYDPAVITNALPLILDLPAWRAIEAPLAELAGICRERGIPLLVSVSPQQYELYPGYSWPEPDKTLSGIFRKLGIPEADLRAPLLAAGGHELFDYRYDAGHPNAAGYGAAASAYRLKMEELGWLSRRIAAGPRK